MEKIDTPPVEEVQGLEGTVHGSDGFGSTGVKAGNDTGRDREKETNGQNERTGGKDSKAKNETLKGSSSGRNRTGKNKTKTEGTSRLSRER